MTEGRKDDTGKLRFDLIPVRPLEEVARVYTIGAAKYDDRNWENGLSWGRVFAALMRHAWAWWRRERLDQTDGQHHLASVVWCALALMEYEETHQELDDRSWQEINPHPLRPLDGSGMDEGGTPPFIGKVGLLRKTPDSGCP